MKRLNIMFQDKCLKLTLIMNREAEEEAEVVVEEAADDVEEVEEDTDHPSNVRVRPFTSRNCIRLMNTTNCHQTKRTQ